MGIKTGDRFINIKTGTIIEVESVYNKPDIYYIGSDDGDHVESVISRDNWHCTLVNVTNNEKAKDISLEGFDSILKGHGDIIKPYTESPIKPISFLKQHNIIQHERNT